MLLTTATADAGAGADAATTVAGKWALPEERSDGAVVIAVGNIGGGDYGYGYYYDCYYLQYCYHY